MFKGKPFLLAAVIFGAAGFIILILAIVSYFCGDDLISGAIGSLLNMEKGVFTDATLAQISLVLFIPTFVFAYRSFADDEPVPEIVPDTVSAAFAGAGVSYTVSTEASAVVSSETSTVVTDHVPADDDAPESIENAEVSEEKASVEE